MWQINNITKEICQEHEPLHIHVEGNGGMAKFEWNGSEFVLAEKQGIKSNDFRKIKTVIDENADIIIKRRNEHFKNKGGIVYEN